MTVLTLLVVLLVGQPDAAPGDLAMIPSLPGVLPPPVAPAVEPEGPPALDDAPAGGSASGSGSPSAPGPEGHVQEQAYQALIDLGRSEDWACMADIFEAESTWNPDGVGDQAIGGSVGLGQRHIPVWGDPRPWTVTDQVAWFTTYADDRYGGWCPARDRWKQRADGRDADGRMIGGWW